MKAWNPKINPKLSSLKDCLLTWLDGSKCHYVTLWNYLNFIISGFGDYLYSAKCVWVTWVQNNVYVVYCVMNALVSTYVHTHTHTWGKKFVFVANNEIMVTHNQLTDLGILLIWISYYQRQVMYSEPNYSCNKKQMLRFWYKASREQQFN